MLATDQNLEILKQYIKDTNASNSSNDKLDVLKQYKDNEFLKKVFFYTYHPFYQFRVTSANLKKNSNLISKNVYKDDLFKLLDDLHLCKITGHDAIGAVNGFIQDHIEYATFIYLIIDRNLETRVTTTSINKVIENLIPEFDVALCEDYDKQTGKKHQPDFDKQRWFASRKLDGCRAIAVVDADGAVTFLSRAGNEFKTLQIAADAIKAAGFKNVILDGEICLIKADGSDDFQGIMKEIKRKDHTIKNPKYKIFDILTPEEFYSKTSEATFSERAERLKAYPLDKYNWVIEVLPQTLITSQDHFEEIRKNASDSGWEGSIIRKDTIYEGKRSKNVLKVKNWYDAEYMVEDIIVGDFRMIDEDIETGKKSEVTEETVTALVIRHKGFIVRVGSGLSVKQRRDWYNNPSMIVGKQITVKYFEESVNQHGEYSLRFPTLKYVYDGKRDV